MSTTRTRLAGFAKLASVGALSALVAGGISAAADSSAQAHGHSHEPANVTTVKNDVKAYYGDTVDAQGHHHHSNDSAWARDVQHQVDGAKRYLQDRLRSHHLHNPALVLDVDDTSEVTYGWEVDVDFHYDPVSNEAAINADAFPAIQPTLELAKWAKAHGVKLFFLTGRPEHQRTATEKDLANDGYPTPDGMFLKYEGGNNPDYLPCAPTCTTIQYKSGTRKHIEAMGNDIVLNLGDQYSDLDGGYADRGVKLSNPMYYLP
jgi:predicted secreted acid phosphatase